MTSYRPQDYAAAFIEGLDAGTIPEETLITRLITAASRNNDRRTLPAIIRAIETKLTERSGGAMITIASARLLSEKDQERFRSSFSPADTIAFTVDPTLSAGVRIIKNGEQELDMSFARTLSKLFS